jgi:hypothetical protein
MSVRRKAVAASAVAAVALGAVAALPAAAAQAAVKPFTVTLGKPSASVLYPGGVSRTFLFKVTNNTGKAEKVSGDLGGSAKGAIALNGNDVRFSIAPVHAPKTAFQFGGEDGGMIGSFYPKGQEWGSYFTLPAHTSYTWKITVGLNKSWPVNDSRYYLFAGAHDDANHYASGMANFQAGSGRNGGPVVAKLTGGTTLKASAPVYETLTLTNRTGAAIRSSYEALGYGENTPGPGSDATIDYDLWNGHAWVPVKDSTLAHPTTWANGATLSYKLRVRVVGKVGTAGKLTLFVDGGATGRYISWGVSKDLQVVKG